MNFWEKAVRFVYGFCWHPTVFDDTDSHDGDAGSVGPHGVSAATVGVSALAQDTDPLGPHGVSATTVGVSALAQDTDSLGPHGVSAATVGVSALAQDLFNFEITSQVPEGLSNHVVSKKKAQASCYKKLLVAWKASNPPPKTPEEASRLVLQTLKQHLKADVEGLLKFYGLPLVPTPVETTVEVPVALPQGVEFELQTLPVEARCVTDGDGITVYVSTSDPRELRLVPQEVLVAALKRSEARARGEKTRAKELHKSIIAAGYQVINVKNEEVLARKYRIRLRGIDAPEGDMPYGKEAKEELAKIVQGKCLRVLVYGEDQYGRSLGDIYCNGNFVQELMLKKGMAWHYKAYDQRAELAKCEKNARAKRGGLWASPNPEEPWEWRKKNK